MLRKRSLLFLLLRGLLVFAVVGGTAVLPVSVSPAASVSDAPFSVNALTANGRVNPLGIGGEDPVFGWQLASARRATAQKAYEIQVGRTAGVRRRVVVRQGARPTARSTCGTAVPT